MGLGVFRGTACAGPPCGLWPEGERGQLEFGELFGLPACRRERTDGLTLQESSQSSGFDSYSASRIFEGKEPTLLPGSDSLVSVEDYHDIIMDDDSPRRLTDASALRLRPSDGQLNTGFKWRSAARCSDCDGAQTGEADNVVRYHPARHIHTRHRLLRDDSVIKLIFAKASDIPAPRPRVDSDSSSIRHMPSSYFSRTSAANSRARADSKPSSMLSFTGFDLFQEVRRGFKFNNNRPAFYPPSAMRRDKHGKTRCSALRRCRLMVGLFIPAQRIHLITVSLAYARGLLKTWTCLCP